MDQIPLKVAEVVSCKTFTIYLQFYQKRLHRSCFPAISVNFLENLFVLKLLHSSFFLSNSFNAANIRLLKVNNRNISKKCEIYSDVIDVNFRDVSHVFLVFL